MGKRAKNRWLKHKNTQQPQAGGAKLKRWWMSVGA